MTFDVDQEVKERLARLEERYAAHVETTKSNFNETKAMIAAQHEQIEELTAALNKYTGFWGAIALVGSSLVGLVVWLKSVLFTKLGLN